MPRWHARKNVATGQAARPSVACALALMLARIAHCGIALAGVDDAIVKSPSFAPMRSDDRHYYVEFRARRDNVFGHSYVVLGAVDGQGRARRLGTMGFGTATGAPSGLPAIFGSAGRIGYTNDDIVSKPIERFRISIDRATVHRIARTTGAMHRTWTAWSG